MGSRKRTIVFIVILAIFAAAAVFAGIHWHVDKVVVQGNSHYSEEQTEDLVMKGPLGHRKPQALATALRR